MIIDYDKIMTFGPTALRIAALVFLLVAATKFPAFYSLVKFYERDMVEIWLRRLEYWKS